LLALFAVGIFVEARSLRQIALLPGAIVLAMFVLLVQAEFTPFTKGANDNASGVAAGLELAGRLMQHPLQAHDILLVFTGCQEVGSYGADAFMSAHPVELRGAVHFVIDQLGGRAGSDGGPCIITGEKFLRTVYCDRRLLAVAERVASQHPELCAHTRFSTIAYSELSTGAKHGLRPLGVFGLDKDGALPNWHLRSDTLANINETTLERSADFVWLLLQAIDLEER
jgi:Zn-dependent M28 family amino/carboxypeptidase